ncbi:uncharacterized protein A4U43_C05F22140 [Asparagus officinalis]|uniref:Uncharacterized protein n=1 Tax=Asparagus officinalis TaxID=4686 RepID=A0A5P1EXV0_ASPOF|nr:uncharacterized protein A4U43_C05F22140 [Asparagus officinalis]
MRMEVKDHIDKAYVTLFDEARYLTGCSAEEYVDSFDEEGKAYGMISGPDGRIVKPEISTSIKNFSYERLENDTCTIIMVHVPAYGATMN